MKLTNKILIGTTIVAMTMILGACSSGSTPASSGTGQTGSTGDSGAPVTLQWGFWDQGTGNPTWEGLAADVTKKYPNITVKLTHPPFADYFTKLQSQLASGTVPCILSMQSLRLPAFADAMEPMDDLLKETGFQASDWNPAALKALQYNGQQYAIPYGFSTLLLYYNKDAFKKAGVAEPKPGWTTADFEDAAKKITAATGKPAWGESFSDLHMFSMLKAYNGAEPVSSDGKLQLTTDKMKQAFQWYAGLATTDKVASVPASASDIPWGEQQLVAGNVAMAADGSWDLLSNATQASFPIGVVTLPQGPDGGGTFSANSGFGISKSCANKKEAAQAIAVITGAEGSATSAKGGNVPARTADMPTFLAAVASQVDPKNPGYSQQVKSVLDDSFKKATPFISTASWDQTTKEIARQFILAYTGGASPAAALQAVQQARGQ